MTSRDSIFSRIAAPLRVLEQVNILDRFVNEFSQRNQCIASAQCRSAREVGSRRRKLIRWRGRNSFAPLPRIDFSNAPAVLAEVSGDVVLPITPRNHAFYDRNLRISEGHFQISEWLNSRHNASTRGVLQRRPA
jgi:hypothetical protein